MLRSTADTTVLATAVESTPTVLFSRYLHLLSLPQSMDSLDIHLPIPGDQEPVDPLCPKTWIE